MDQSFKCTNCSIIFRTNQSLDKHFSEIHTNKYKFCTVCNLRVSKKKFACHLYTHENLKIYECQKCLLMYKTKYHLDRHFDEKHLGKNNICCSCGEAFTRKDKLQTHIQNFHRK